MWGGGGGGEGCITRGIFTSLWCCKTSSRGILLGLWCCKTSSRGILLEVLQHHRLVKMQVHACCGRPEET